MIRWALVDEQQHRAVAQCRLAMSSDAADKDGFPYQIVEGNMQIGREKNRLRHGFP